MDRLPLVAFLEQLNADVARGLRMFLRDGQPGDLITRSLSVRAQTLDDKTRSVEVTIATDNPATVWDSETWQQIDEVLRMDGCAVPAQMPMLADHDRYSIDAIRGSIRGLRVDGGSFIGRAFFADDADSETAWQKVRAGHLTDLSVGYGVDSYVDIPAGQTESVNGVAYTARTRRLRVSTRWTPREASLVPIGADPASKVRGERPPSTTRTTTPKESPMNFDAWLRARGIDAATLTAARRAELEAEYTGAQRAAAGNAGAGQPAAVAIVAAVPAVPAHDEAARAAAIAGERTRTEGIYAAAGEDMPPSLVRRAVVEQWPLERAHAEFLAEMRRARPAAVTVEVVAASEDKFQRAAIAAMSLRAGVRPERVGAADVALARDLHVNGLQSLARQSCQVHRVEASENPDALLKRALSTFSFPNALGTTLNRVLQAGYDETPSTLLQWAQPKSVKDFRTNTHVRIGKFANPQKVGRGGDLQSGTLSEEAENYKAETYGTLFLISRQNFIDDDLGAFTEVPMKLGASMKRNIDELGYGTGVLGAASGVGPTLLSDTTALFNTGRSDGANYATGGGTVLSMSSLRDAKSDMRKIKQGGVILSLLPLYLVVPPELEFTARQLVTSAEYRDTTASTAFGTANPHQGTVTVIVEPRLSALTNGGTAWYLIADWRQAEHLAVSFLNGNQSPTVERKDPADVLGIGWQAYFDMGVDVIGWRGISRRRGA